MLTTRRLKPMVAMAGVVVLPLAAWSVSSTAWRSDGTIYYVDQNHPRASDRNPGTETLPWKTLYRAADPVGTEVVAGDTVVVKAGTYDVSTGGQSHKPAIMPANSGERGNPITFKAHPGHAVILDARNVLGNPAIGSYARDYVVIDGFTIVNAGDKGIVVSGSEAKRTEGVVIQNSCVSGVSRPDGDNTDGIRLQSTSGVIVRNNRVHNVHNRGTEGGTHNAAGIKLYQVDHAVIENNEIFDVETGIYDKQQGEFNTFRRNIIHGCGQVGIRIAWEGRGPHGQGDQVYENIILNCPYGLAVVAQPGALIFDTAFYNNTLVNYTRAGLTLPGGGMAYRSNTRLWNNIFYRLAQPGSVDVFTYDDPPLSIGLSDYNLFAAGPSVHVGRHGTDRRFTSLSAWQAASGWDRNSRAGVPEFANLAMNDFRLRPGSPASGTGRVGGTRTGAPVNIGAYTSGTEQIGIINASPAGTPRSACGARPAAPI